MSKKQGDQANRNIQPNGMYLGDCRELMKSIEPDSIDLSFWSPPYFVGKEYELGLRNFLVLYWFLGGVSLEKYPQKLRKVHLY
jgi:DNA modification methylase